MAVYFWSAIAAVGVLSPFVAALARAAVDSAFGGHGASRSDEEPSRPSLASLPSWPSTPA
jgi:hypothetical protein